MTDLLFLSPLFLQLRPTSAFVPNGLPPRFFSECASPLVLHDKTTTNWFRVGDSVVVVEDVFLRNGGNFKGARGKVIETWESCDVDPACCCSEQVEADLAVRVQFDCSECSSEPLVYYFSEKELAKVDR
jgi:hypothetical protein